MSFISGIFLVQIIIILTFSAYGIIFSRFIFQNKMEDQTFYFPFLKYIPLMSITLFVFAFVLSFFPVRYKLFISILILFIIPVIIILFYTTKHKLKILNVIKTSKNKIDFKKSKIYVYLYSVIFIAIVLFSTSQSPYPGLLTLETGDLPEFYRITENIHLGKGYIKDYATLDHWSGKPIRNRADLNYPVNNRLPFVPYIASLFYPILGHNLYIINILTCLYGVLILFAAIELFFYFKRKKEKDFVISISVSWLFLIIISITGYYFVYASSGAILNIEVFFLLLSILFIQKFSFSNYPLCLYASIPLAILCITRGEGIIAAFLVFVFFLVPNLIKEIFRKRKFAMLLKPFIVGLLSLTLFIPTALYFHSSNSSQQFAFHFLKYFPENSKFDFLRMKNNDIPQIKNVPIVNWNIVYQQIQSKTNLDEITNHNVLSEIKTYPLAFIKFIGRNVYIFETNIIVLFLLIFLFSLLDNFRLNVFLIYSVLFVLMFLMLNMYWGLRYYYFFIGFYFVILLSALNYLCLLYQKFQVWFKRKFRGKFVGFYNRFRIIKISRISKVLVICFFILALTFLIQKRYRYMQLIRFQPANISYQIIIDWVNKNTKQNDFIVSEVPQLITSCTGRQSIGSSWNQFIYSDLIRKFSPDYIILTKFRKELIPLTYDYMEKRNFILHPNYKIIIKGYEYIIWKKVR